MKKPVLCALALSIGLLASGGVTLSEEKKPTAAPKLNAASKINTGVSVPDGKQLYKPGSNLKISKETQPKVLTLPSRSDAIPTYDPITPDLEAFKRAVAEDHAAKTAFTNKARECWDRDYTQADQATAGCRATDTLSVCYEKLATVCVTPALDRARIASSGLETAHKKLKNTLIGYMQQINR